MIKIFYGDDDYAINQTINSIKDKFISNYSDLGLQQFNFETLANLDKDYFNSIFGGPSLFSQANKLIIINNLADKLESGSNFSEPIDLFNAIINSNSATNDLDLIILSARKLDKTRKLYKAIYKQPSFKVFTDSTDQEIIKFIQEQSKPLNLNLSSQIEHEILKRTNSNKYQILNTLNSLSLYPENNVISLDLLDNHLVKDGETVAFNIFEKAISKNSSLLNELLDLQQQKEEPQKFIGLLTQQASSLATSYQITNSINPQQVKIHPYVHKKNQELIKRQKLNKIKINKIIDIIIQLNIDSKTLSLNYNDLWLLIEHSCRNISTF